jgi:DNA-binding NarL/FixJ family response regulator
VTRLRAVTVATPALLRDLIVQLAHRSAPIDVVAEYGDVRGLERRLRLVRPDVVVIGLPSSQSARIARRALALLPAARVIVVSDDGHAFVGFRLQFRSVPFTDASTDCLAGFMRGGREG